MIASADEQISEHHRQPPLRRWQRNCPIRMVSTVVFANFFYIAGLFR